MNIKFKLHNSTLYILMIGELDENTADYARLILDDNILNYVYDNVIFDMSELEFMDSTGIGVLIGRYKKLKNKQKNIYIANPSRTIEKIFNMSGIYEIMPKIS